MREKSNARGLTASYLEPDRYEDDEEALEQSLLAMKRQYKKGLAKGKYTSLCLVLTDVLTDSSSATTTVLDVYPCSAVQGPPL